MTVVKEKIKLPGFYNEKIADIIDLHPLFHTIGISYGSMWNSMNATMEKTPELNRYYDIYICKLTASNPTFVVYKNGTYNCQSFIIGAFNILLHENYCTTEEFLDILKTLQK